MVPPPGGGNEKNETPEETCAREVKEEVGLDVKVGPCLLISQGFYYFACEMVDKSQTIKLQEKECNDYKWVEPENFKTLGFIMELKKMERLFRKIISHRKP